MIRAYNRLIRERGFHWLLRVPAAASQRQSLEVLHLVAIRLWLGFASFPSGRLTLVEEDSTGRAHRHLERLRIHPAHSEAALRQLRMAAEFVLEWSGARVSSEHIGASGNGGGSRRRYESRTPPRF